MKKPVKTKPIDDDVKCEICGIEHKHLRILRCYDIRNCTIPAFEIKSKEACAVKFGTICTECKQAILNHVWNTVIMNKPDKNTLGLFFNLDKDIKNFIKDNQADFKEIANEYRHISNVITTFDNMVYDITKHTTELHEDFLVIPSYDGVLKLISTINNDHIRLDKDQTLTTDRVRVLVDEEITKENANDVISDEHMAEDVQAIPGIRFMMISVEPETFYESEVEVRMSFMVLDINKYRSAKNEQTESSVIKIPKDGKHNNTPLNDTFGIDTDLGNFKID